MLNDPIVLVVVDALNAEKIPFLVAGSLSSNVYGVPRSTRDADFVIELGSASVMSLRTHLPAHYHLDPQIQFESVTATLRNIIRVEGSTFKVELFRLSTDPHDQERFRRRVSAEVEGRTVYLPTAEDVVVTKLRWARELKRPKDLDDLRNVILLQQATLDWDYVYEWCDRHETRELLEDIRREIANSGNVGGSL